MKIGDEIYIEIQDKVVVVNDDEQVEIQDG